MRIKINLAKELPKDFTISYDELKNWHLGKYKPNSSNISELFKFDIKAIDEVEIIFENVSCFAGRFNLQLKERMNPENIRIDFIVAKHILEKTKNRFAFRTEHFSKLTEKQVLSLHAKIIDQIIPECQNGLRQYKEFHRQKAKLSS